MKHNEADEELRKFLDTGNINSLQIGFKTIEYNSQKIVMKA